MDQKSICTRFIGISNLGFLKPYITRSYSAAGSCERRAIPSEQVQIKEINNRFNLHLEWRAIRKIQLRYSESTKFPADRYFGSLIPKSTRLATKISGDLLSSIFS
jgi:hypothetical protein